eukprot:436129-Ditylum_brightwellii.AAC.1
MMIVVRVMTAVALLLPLSVQMLKKVRMRKWWRLPVQHLAHLIGSPLDVHCRKIYLIWLVTMKN